MVRIVRPLQQLQKEGLTCHPGGQDLVPVTSYRGGGVKEVKKEEGEGVSKSGRSRRLQSVIEKKNADFAYYGNSTCVLYAARQWRGMVEGETLGYSGVCSTSRDAMPVSCSQGSGRIRELCVNAACTILENTRFLNSQVVPGEGLS